ncbi:MAG: S41 family peptidase [Porphyromonadaceae bacterium]|jgi:hypothetical protein|nr:S41 family peptidase [Porphyromonadaceae bacterium]
MSKFTSHIFIVISIAFTFNSCLREPAVEPDTYRGNFESLWKIIDTRYCYLDYKEIDWNTVYRKYSPQIDTVTSKYGLFDVLAEMLDELKDGHVNLYSSFDRSRYWNWFSDYPSNFDSKIIFNAHYLGEKYRIAGPFRYKRIASDQVGYAYYGSFSSNFSYANIQALFDNFKNCKGMIIDVRNNSGGMVTNAELLSSFFFKEKTLTGYISHKIADGHSDFSKPTPVYTIPHKTMNWDKPIIILTNRMSYSATNEFICRMKYAPNAKIVGDKTGGGGGFPLSSELPNGWMVRFSASPMFNAEMEHTEWGIDPDKKVDMNIADKLAGMDTIIEEAVKEIL